MILVVFLGNDVMGDEGIGYHLYKYMDGLMPEYAKGVFLHTDVLRLPHFYSGEDTLVFVDAVVGENFTCGKAKPMSAKDVKKLEASMKHAHMIGVIDSLELLEKTMPEIAGARKVFYLIGVDEDNIKPSTELSQCLRKNLHVLSAELLKLLHHLHYTC
ncbi:MAG: hydrogenase maturation protease [Dictyoglomi bacterium]|nr:hydrogenase maturation protease [Dictyoglomota bacterium]